MTRSDYNGYDAKSDVCNMMVPKTMAVLATQAMAMPKISFVELPALWGHSCWTK